MARLSADSDDCLLNLINHKKLSVRKCVCVLSLTQKYMHSDINSDINPCMFICDEYCSVSHVLLICKLFSELSSSGSLLVTWFF